MNNPYTNGIGLVLVKPENDSRIYLFKATNALIKAGDLILVNTKHGTEIATCMCDTFTMEMDSEEYRKIVRRMGVSEPLEKVVGIYRLERYPEETI